MDGTVFNGDPAANGGAEIVVTDESGWFSSAPVRTGREDRPDTHGTYRAPTWRGAAVITLAGWLWAPNPVTRRAAEIRLAGLCSDPHALYPLRHNDTSTGEDSVRLVELDGPVLINQQGPRHAGWSLQLAAPDPARYSAYPNTLSTGLPRDGGGLDWDTGGLGSLDFTGGGLGGLDFGTPSSTGALTLTNPGSAPAWPAFTITGPVQFPEVIDPATGAGLAFAGDLAAGQRLVIDTHPHRRTVTRDGIGGFRPYLRQAAWLSVPPGGALTVAFRATSYTADALLTAAWHTTWW
ncbi:MULTISPECIES: phage tail domain-containing protein [unclassified Crossiella]|uniref:phage tail domain-containing protein n=1 Tax=unclassified Crossiella TaxID=2620835 RepID=UPI001FFFE07B|nr:MULTISPECIES: phage tail domain-containing protein [unclassified Crossiella]MCK2242316.1 phage tail family protein [Crossiella sp. S99.2]MCK2254653.1 phage tail family protein [Crossiella sp. S99.1]